MYEAIHRGHRAAHPLVALKDEVFPACRACGARVRFRLLQAVPHATHDWDLAGPSLFLIKGEQRKKKRA